MKVDWSSIKKRAAKSTLGAILLLLLASSPANAIIGIIIAAVVIYLVALIVRMAFISKYVLMFLIVINPCIMAPCPSYPVGEFTVTFPEDPVVKLMNKDLLLMFQGFYVVAILYYAVYVIFMSSSPSGRAKAKNMLISLLVGMVIVSQSRVILQLTMDISRAVAYSVLDIANQRLANLASLGMMARAEMCIMDLVFMSLGMVAVMMAGMRYFFILLMACFFPLALFLYFIPITKNYGILLIRFTMLIIFIQVIQAMLYSVTIIAAVDETGLGGFIIAIGGLFGVIYSPLLAMKLMGWLGAVTHFYSTRAGGASTRFMAMLMRGQSVGSAFQTAGAQYMIGHNMGPAMRGLPGAPLSASIAVPGAGGAARPAAGYGIRSARSFRGMVEGRAGMGSAIGTGVGSPGRAGGAAEEGEGVYVAPGAASRGGARVQKRSKAGMPPAAAAGGGAAEAAEEAAAKAEAGETGMPAVSTAVRGAGFAAMPRRPSMATKGMPGQGFKSMEQEPAMPSVSGFRPEAAAKGGPGEGFKAMVPGAAAAGVLTGPGALAADRHADEYEASTVEQLGKTIHEKEKEVTEREKGGKPDSKGRAELDKLRQKHKEEMGKLTIRKINLLEQLRKTGLAGAADEVASKENPTQADYSRFLRKAEDAGVEVPSEGSPQQRVAGTFNRMMEVPSAAPAAAPATLQELNSTKSEARYIEMGETVKGRHALVAGSTQTQGFEITGTAVDPTGRRAFTVTDAKGQQTLVPTTQVTAIREELEQRPTPATLDEMKALDKKTTEAQFLALGKTLKGRHALVAGSTQTQGFEITGTAVDPTGRRAFTVTDAKGQQTLVPTTQVTAIREELEQRPTPTARPRGILAAPVPTSVLKMTESMQREAEEKGITEKLRVRRSELRRIKQIEFTTKNSEYLMKRLDEGGFEVTRTNIASRKAEKFNADIDSIEKGGPVNFVKQDGTVMQTTPVKSDLRITMAKPAPSPEPSQRQPEPAPAPPETEATKQATPTRLKRTDYQRIEFSTRNSDYTLTPLPQKGAGFQVARTSVETGKTETFNAKTDQIRKGRAVNLVREDGTVVQTTPVTQDIRITRTSAAPAAPPTPQPAAAPPAPAVVPEVRIARQRLSEVEQIAFTTKNSTYLMTPAGEKPGMFKVTRTRLDTKEGEKRVEAFNAAVDRISKGHRVNFVREDGSVMQTTEVEGNVQITRRKTEVEAAPAAAQRPAAPPNEEKAKKPKATKAKTPDTEAAGKEPSIPKLEGVGSPPAAEKTRDRLESEEGRFEYLAKLGAWEDQKNAQMEFWKSSIAGDAVKNPSTKLMVEQMESKFKMEVESHKQKAVQRYKDELRLVQHDLELQASETKAKEEQQDIRGRMKAIESELQSPTDVGTAVSKLREMKGLKVEKEEAKEKEEEAKRRRHTKTETKK